MTTERERNLEEALERARYRINELERQLQKTKDEARKTEDHASSLEWKAKEHDRAEKQRARSYDMRDPFNVEESVRVLLDDWSVPAGKTEVDRIEAVLIERDDLRARLAAAEGR